MTKKMLKSKNDNKTLSQKNLIKKKFTGKNGV